MANWYYAIGREHKGPLLFDGLKSLVGSGVITAKTMVWHEGSADWVAAETVPNLINSKANSPFAPAPTLAYATSAVSPGSALLPEMPTLDDAGPFHKIGSQFTVSKKRWAGVAVASPEAIYLLKISQQRQNAYLAGGLLGILLTAALSGDDMTRSCDITELPGNIRDALDPKGKRKKGDVVILRRDAMHLIKTSGFGSSITPHIGNEKFPITARMFGGLKKAKTFLNENGWTLDYPVTPTAAPTHGKGLGLDSEALAKRKRSMMVRIAMVILAVALFVGLVILQIAFHH